MAYPQLNPANEGARVLRLLASRRVQRRLCARVAEVTLGLALVLMLCHLVAVLPSAPEDDLLLVTVIRDANNTSVAIR
jgi:hypothetical protein